MTEWFSQSFKVPILLKKFYFVFSGVKKIFCFLRFLESTKISLRERVDFLYVTISPSP